MRRGGRGKWRGGWEYSRIENFEEKKLGGGSGSVEDCKFWTHIYHNKLLVGTLLNDQCKRNFFFLVVNRTHI